MPVSCLLSGFPFVSGFCVGGPGGGCARRLGEPGERSLSNTAR